MDITAQCELPDSLIEDSNCDRSTSSCSGENSVHPIEFLEQLQHHSPPASSLHNFGHRFVCIEYPGLVRDDEKVMKTLGGLDAISTAYNKKNRRVELRFRPDDLYCKPVCGNKHQIIGLLLKVKVRRKRPSVIKETLDLSTQKAEDSSASSGEVTSVTVLGQVNTSYRFKNLCDFQYIPTDGKTCIYESLVPSTLPSTSWLYEDADYFLPPPVFSRMDNMQPYFYQKDKLASSAPRNIISCTRQRRAGHAMFINYEVKTIPKKPRPQTLKVIQFKNLNGDPLTQMKDLFADRPVWSKSALLAVSGLSKDQIKYLLPCVAYYFVTGPWRVMWVRFGYDPRLDTNARRYQTLDFRLRTAGGLKAKIKAKRSYSNYLLPYKSASQRIKTAIISNDSSSSSAPSKSQLDPTESYIFRPGTLPPSRQMFYQYCDIHVPEIEAMLEKLPTPTPYAKCHERHGWMPPGLDVQCRDIINDLVLEKLRDDAREDADAFNCSLPGTMNREGDEDEYDDEDSFDDEEDDDEEEEDEDGSWGQTGES